MNKLQILVAETKKEFKPSEEKCNEVITNIRREVKSYVEKSKLKSLVVGVSGGLDSAVVAALCQEKYTGVPLIGLHIPLATTDEHSEFARAVGEEYCTVYNDYKNTENTGCIETKAVDFLESIVAYNEDVIYESPLGTKDIVCHNESIRQGNVKARIRMIALYDMARLNDGLVLSTDNYSEYLAGFWTTGGDIGDYCPIQYVFKGLELPYIARALGVREDIITQPPSDGLGVTEENTDEAQLGCNYETFDTIMIDKLMRPTRLNRTVLTDEENALVRKVMDRHSGTSFKRNGSVSIDRRRLGFIWRNC